MPYDPSAPYEICLKGHLDTRWSDWFDGLTISIEDTGNTRLIGPIADQAALHGLLAKIRDLGLPLISLTRVSSPQETAPKTEDEAQKKNTKHKNAEHRNTEHFSHEDLSFSPTQKTTESV